MNNKNVMVIETKAVKGIIIKTVYVESDGTVHNFSELKENPHE